MTFRFSKKAIRNQLKFTGGVIKKLDQVIEFVALDTTKDFYVPNTGPATRIGLEGYEPPPITEYIQPVNSPNTAFSVCTTLFALYLVYLIIVCLFSYKHRVSG